MPASLRISLTDIFLYGMMIVSIVGGGGMFFLIHSTQNQYADKLESIEDGTVKPEQLTVVRKYIAPSRTSGDHHHVVLRASGADAPEIDLQTTPKLYSAVNQKGKVTAYLFSDGYFIPESYGTAHEGVKWILLGLGLMFGAIMLAIILWRRRRTVPAQPAKAKVQPLGSPLRR